MHVEKDENMPVDDYGNRAEYVMDPDSRINRMNLAGLYELYTTAASRDLGNKIREALGIPHGDIHAYQKVKAIAKTEPSKLQWAWGILTGYYKIMAPKQYEWAVSGTMSEEEIITEIATVCKDFVYLYMPPEYSPLYEQAVMEIEKSPYRPNYGPVTYIGYDGKKVRTKNNIRIGSLYIIMLEKIGDDASAVASGKYQHYGVLAKLTREDKNSEPFRAQPIKGIGETEGRIFMSYAGEKALAELMDRNSNPATHAEVVNSILQAEQPSCVDELVDRSKTPYGNTKPLQIVDHISLCAGWQLEYTPDDPRGPVNG